jgi:hypothetical protein
MREWQSTQAFRGWGRDARGGSYVLSELDLLTTRFIASQQEVCDTGKSAEERHKKLLLCTRKSWNSLNIDLYYLMDNNQG